jgi:hypothetical protein
LSGIFSPLFWINLDGSQALEKWWWKAGLQCFKRPVDRDSPSMTTDVNMLISIKDYEWYPMLGILQYYHMT